MADTALSTPPALGALYQDYAYSYPHKSAYGPLEAPRRLRDVWEKEEKSRLFLYVHIPFCEMRCGFCNLFATTDPHGTRLEAYLEALEREFTAAQEEVGDFTVARAAIGGGTPTILEPAALARLFDRLSARFGLEPEAAELSIETSPKTATPERIALLSQLGIARISIGAQSFVETETRAMGRPQRASELTAALDTIRSHRFSRLNIDLIYGASNQTVESWCASIRLALNWTPEEMYLYPLYVRRGVGIDGRAQVEDEHRLALYRAGRELLLSQGYRQISMRAFRRYDSLDSATAEYACQEDGMLGLGAGARSYTTGLHYSTDYAVSGHATRQIIDAYSARSTDEFRRVDYGIDICADERMRRYVLKSILRVEGLDVARFEALFGAPILTAAPLLSSLIDLGFYDFVGADRIVPTALGLEHSDAIPPLFYSDAVRARMDGAEAA